MQRCSASPAVVAPRPLVPSRPVASSRSRVAPAPRVSLSHADVAGGVPKNATSAPKSAGPARRAQRVSPIVLNAELARSATHQEVEVIESLKPVFESDILPLLPAPEDLWQPSDFLPDAAGDEDAFFEGIRDLRKRVEGLSDEVLLCIVGDAITEEALPTYMAMLNTIQGVRDETGRDEHPYAKWTRAWIAEENRHGDLLNKYMYFSGRINMKAVELTTQHLISSGMDPGTMKHPYNAFVFTSFQERATKVSHGSTARIAHATGDEALAKICGTIARDEGRHEAAYTRVIDAVFDVDPSGAMLSFARMMAKKITMPAHLMDDGTHATTNAALGDRNLFADFSAVAEKIGVYTARDYVGILRHLIRRWDIENRTGLTDVAAAARDFLCDLPERFEKLAERRAAKAKAASANAPPTEVAFSWIFNRKVAL